LLNSPRYELTITFNSSDRWTPSFSVPRWYDAVASLCHLFSRGNDHVVETSRAHHYRAPCCHRRIAPLVLTSVGWDDRCAPLRYKREALPRCCHYQVSPAFELDSAATLCFSLQLVFGQPPTSPSLLLLRPLTEQAVPPSSSTTSRGSSKEDREKDPNRHCRPWLRSWRCSSPSAGRL
jgi:hypothetical protein